MISQSVEERSCRVLIHAPFGRDGALIRDMVVRAGMAAEACGTMAELGTAAREGAGAILVGDEALTKGGLEQLQNLMREQPPWSDLPVFVMTRPMENRSRYSFLKRLEGLGNTNMLERPLRVDALVSTFQMALRARLRQYEVRDFVEAERRGAQTIRLANGELRRVNEDLNQFAYSVSHDLQEPLRMVAVYTQLLQREFGAELQGDAPEYMKFVVQGARRMEELLKDLLSYVQVANTAQDVSTQCDAEQVLDQALANLQETIEKSGASIERGGLPMVMVQPVHLLQLFQNLIGNALKYRGEKNPHVGISARRRDGEWRFDVQDNGIGVDPEFAEHIFGVFKRLHGTDERYPGTGIGLAICQRIVARYGGRIWVESEGAGKGSLFSFTFPAGPAGGDNGG
jgi:signal transduction histidine kinase